MSYLRQDPAAFYVYPEHVSGIRGMWKRLLWRMGFDPLTVRQRLEQVDIERRYWKPEWADLENQIDE